MEVVLYKYSGLPNKVGKTLQDGTTINGLLHDMTRVDGPTIDFRGYGGIVTHTYAYIAEFGRFYFIDDWRINTDGTFTATLRVDLLQTYADDIRAAMGVVAESDTPNKFASNRESVHDERTAETKYDFPNAPLTENGSIIMVTLKGRQ